MTEIFIKMILSYLLGSVMGGLVIGALRGGTDIRTLGSGNAGASNAWRTQGPAFGLAVFVIDIGKGVLAVLWLPGLDTGLTGPDSPLLQAAIPYLCGLAVMLGHIYPVLYGFRGGKGAATIMGVIVCLVPDLVPVILLAWITIMLVSGYSALSTLVAGFAGMAGGIVTYSGPQDLPRVIFLFLVCMSLVYTHRSNIQRLRLGEENRFDKIMLINWFR